MQTHWPETAAFIKKEWPLLTDAAIRGVNGDFDKFLKILKETYNQFPLEEAKAREKIQRFVNTLE
ncbi:MAG: hypothetical protein Q7T11_05965 [Deltaproteobacteria bacterium]|nr:hypothetical protein [Deltaproteobacteria bacterium]